MEATGCVARAVGTTAGPALPTPAVAATRTGAIAGTLAGGTTGGFVERTPDPRDRRRNVITLTGRGRVQLRRLAKQVARIQDELLAPLSAAERQELTALLRRLLRDHGGEG